MKLLILDGNSIVNRAFYGIRLLTNAEGTPTNALYGFLMILQKLLTDEAPDALCVAFDRREPTFRHLQYEGYKATRTGMPDELAVQMPILKEILDAMSIPRYEIAGWEADDILGTVARITEESGNNCVIVSGDRDCLQLVTDKTRVLHVKSRMGQTETVSYTPDVFTEEYGFEPKLLVDLKALMGDTSDNIPGVKGVGEKTAKDLVRRFGSIDAIFENIGSNDIKDAVRKKLEEDRKNAELSYSLATISRAAPIAFVPSDNLRKPPDNDALYALFKKLDFTKLIEKFGLVPGANAGGGDLATPRFSPAITEISDIAQITAIADNAQITEILDITESRGAPGIPLVAQATPPAGICESGVFAVIPVFSGDKVIEVFLTDYRAGQTYILRDCAQAQLAELFSERYKKVGHNTKDTMLSLSKAGFSTDGWVFDTAIAAYLLAPTDSKYALDRLAGLYLGYGLKSANTNVQLSLLDEDISNEQDALAEECAVIAALYEILPQKLSETGLTSVFEGIDFPLCQVLADMEREGFYIDRDALIVYGDSLREKEQTLEKEIYITAGEEFNINSPKQLGVILFEKLMLPAPKKTKTGYSTNAEVLDSLAGKHPIIGQIKTFRELSKLRSTYAEGLLHVIAPDGRIHTNFQMTVTATGRLSSIEPNLQNIPVRRKLGSELRSMFAAREGCLLVDADYSQIELRLLAHIADDDAMIAAFLSGEDFHTVTASQVFNVPLDGVTANMRRNAKAVNFGIVYGISAFSLANDIGVPVYEAKEYIENYLKKYAGVAAYMKDIVVKAKQDGFVETLFGRRRYLPELKSSNFNLRSFGERVALNMPIQGTAADIIKLAMIRVSGALKAEKLSSKLILQVHDELLVECPEAETETVRTLLKREMEGAAALSVPLTADVHVGRNWLEAK